MRLIDRDLIRGGHYGQRSCEPHSKAEHMAAPTNAAFVKKNGRALQAENDDLEKCWSCASVSGLLMERSAPGHHGYPHALDLIRVSAPKAIWAT
jgi:hypothetical protein